MAENRKPIFNKFAVLLAMNRREARARIEHGHPFTIFEGIYGDHSHNVLMARRAKNKVAKASRKRNRR